MKIKPYINKFHLLRNIIIEILYIVIYLTTLTFSIEGFNVVSTNNAAIIILYSNILVLGLEIINCIYEIGKFAIAYLKKNKKSKI